MRHLLTTSRLVISTLTDGDADDLVDMLMKDGLYVVIGDAPTDRAAAYARVGRWTRGSPTSDALWLNDVVRSHDTDAVVGMCQATVSPHPDGGAGECRLGYLVDPDHHGRGIAQEMMAAFTDHIVTTMSPRVLAAHIASGHTPSERVAASLGLAVTDAVDDSGERIWIRRR